MRLFIAFGVCALLVGCSKPQRLVATLGTIAAAERLVAASLSHAPPVEAKDEPKPAVKDEPQASDTAPPPGYVRMRPEARSSPAFGNAVLLFDDNDQTVVPIFIGGTEALSIQLRLEGKRFKRPLTHDLMDDALGKLGAELSYVRVDALRGNVFIGSVVMTKADEVFELDARPSDAIALAIGNEIPIFVSRQLIDKTGIRTDELRGYQPDEGSEPMAL